MKARNPIVIPNVSLLLKSKTVHYIFLQTDDGADKWAVEEFCEASLDDVQT